MTVIRFDVLDPQVQARVDAQNAANAQTRRDSTERPLGGMSEEELRERVYDALDRARENLGLTERPKGVLDAALDRQEEQARRDAHEGPPVGAMTSSGRVEQRRAAEPAPSTHTDGRPRSILHDALDRAEEQARKDARGGPPAGAMTRTGR